MRPRPIKTLLNLRIGCSLRPHQKMRRVSEGNKVENGSVTDNHRAMATQLETLPIPASLQMAIEVERRLREQQVGMFFVMPRVVRRVLQSELDITSPWQPPPHRKCCVVARDRVLWVVARDELGVDAHANLPEQLILIAQPEEDQLATMSREELQRHYWRLMFHARIDFEMGLRTRPDQMSAADLRYRIDLIGQTTFDEIRSVLRAEQMLLRPDDDRNVFSEFVAVYNELSAFAPNLVPLYFPSLKSSQKALEVIGSECDAKELLESTRPAELAADESVTTQDSESSISGQISAVVTVRKSSARQYANLVRRAERLSEKENNVRAALAFQTALDVAPPEMIDEARNRLEAEIQKLVSRLQSALELSDNAAHPWLRMYEKLLPSAQRGFWNANARLLYDLQKVCFDHEHEIYKVDLLRWGLSLGKSPLKRPLSNQRIVLMSKHLRAATLRAANVEIDSADRSELNELLHEAADAAEHILRFRLEPLIARALMDAGFTPTSIVELVSLKKIIHELADGVVDRGFITLGSLRDAVSRNQLKMTDLTSINEFFEGDPLLRADRFMSASLDGVYPRGPFYLRWLQKVNSLVFGIPWGRQLTSFVALPFGLAFLLLKFVDNAVEHLPFVDRHISHPADSIATDEHTTTRSLGETAGTPDSPHHVDVFYSHQAMFLLGLVIFSLIHFAVFRRRVVWFLTTTWTVLRFLMIDIPRAILRWRLADLLFKSFPMMLFRRFVLGPVIATSIFWFFLPKLGLYQELNRWWGLAILLLSFLLLNSRIGRDTEELAREFFARTWYRIRVHLVMGLITLIIDVFGALMDGLERVLYAVDEWLRFRSGESNLTLGLKAVIGLVWAFVHGVIRFCVTLLIEPQVNPIKHFPVVTVSHKIVFATLFFPIFTILQRFFEKPATAYTVTVLILTSIPGVFGFLAWELKENWQLYKANRSPKLKPVPIGDHGETLQRLLRPGLHSGTIPRLFAKQRRAARRNTGTATVNRQAKFATRLHHEATAVRHFIERELIAVLRESRTFRDYTITVADVELTTNRVLVKIQETSMPDHPIELEFSEQSGWLAAVIRDTGWLDNMEPDDAQVFKAALTGLYKLAAVDLVREQIESQISIATPQTPAEPIPSSSIQVHPYDIGPSGLVIWPNGSYETELHYPLDETPVTHPRPRFLARACGLNPLPIEALVFNYHVVEWDEWRQFWDNEQNIPAHSTARFPFKW